MKIRKLLILIILLAVSFGVFAGELEDFKKTTPVVMNCLSSVFVTKYSSFDIELPCTAVSFEDSLPKRVSFFLADPSDYLAVMQKYVEGQGGVLSGILAMLSKTSSDPFITAVYLSMLTGSFDRNEYLLSGNISIDYPEGTTIEQISSIWFYRKYVNERIKLTFDLCIYGYALQTPLDLKGAAEVYLTDEGKIVLETCEGFKVNDKQIEKTSFAF